MPVHRDTPRPTDVHAHGWLPGTERSGAKSAVEVLPQQADEFVCTRCALVHHWHNMADEDAQLCFGCS